MNRLAWSVTDIGTTHGAILVERLRTLGGRVFALEEHLQRLFEGAQKLGIPRHPAISRAKQVCEELLERNRQLIKHVAMLVSSSSFLRAIQVLIIDRLSRRP